MKTSAKHITQILFMLLAFTVLSSDYANAQLVTSKKKFEPFLTRGKTTWGLNAGVRMHTFDWNIASDTTGNATPNILSELTWRDLMMFEVGGEVRHEEPLDYGTLKGGLHFEANANVGFALEGENQDSDYLGDNRTGEFSRTIADSDGGYAVNGSVAVGYKAYLTGDPTRRAYNIMRGRRPKTAAGRARYNRELRKAYNNASPVITMTPLVGYAVSQHDYRMKSVDQVIPDNGPLDVDDFDWHYLSTWYGPFLGLEGEVRGKKNMVKLRGEYHMPSFYGEGFWRGRAGFRQDPSYVHTADGDGLLVNAEYAYALGEDYALTIDANYKKLQAEDGEDETYLVNNTTSRIRLNEVNDESYGLQIGVRYNW